MKANRMSVSVELLLDHAPDSLNRTTVWLDDFVIWPTRGAENICAGQRLGISIPSGTLDGTVVSVREVPADGISLAFPYLDVRLASAHWDGLANGLANGFCGCGRFHVAADTGYVWQSSALPEGLEVAYEDYELVRWATDIFEDHAAAMRAVFEAACAAEYGPAWAEEENAVLFLSHESILSVLPEGIADNKDEGPLEAGPAVPQAEDWPYVPSTSISSYLEAEDEEEEMLVGPRPLY